MAEPYLTGLSALVSSLDNSSQKLEYKHFFGGAALYIGGKICASLSPKGLAFKLSPQRCDEIFAKADAASINASHAVPLRYFDSSPIKRGYILLPNYREIDSATIAAYFEECFVYAEST